MCRYIIPVVYSVLCLCLVMYPLHTGAQNLVPNPSFENYNNCPVNGLGPTYPQIVYSAGYNTFPAVQDWVSPTVNGSPDYFNSCAPVNTPANVPATAFGYQQTHSGQAYMGIYIFRQFNNGANDYREYIQCKLLNPLVAGTRYKVSFYVCSGSGFTSDDDFVATDQLGIKLSQTKIDSPDKIRSVNPQAVNPTGNYLIDSINWMLVTDTILATGGEQWLTMGNFTHTLPPATWKLVYPAVHNSFHHLVQYVYIDDVCVLDISHPVQSDTTVCVASFPATIKARIHGTYKWNNGTTTDTITITEPGKYWYEVTGDCSYHVDTIIVKANVGADLDIGPDTFFCSNTVMTIAANYEYDSYQWSTGATTRAINVLKGGTYVLTATNTCGQYTDTIRLAEKQLPDNELGNDTTVCKDKPLQVGNNQPGVSYTWNTGDSSCCINIDKSGKYLRVAHNQCGTVVDSVVIDMPDCRDCMYVPTAFSPNDDGLNDRFGGIPKCPIKTYYLQVFNRWGERVFASENPANKWDGTYKNRLVDAGVYYYSLRYTADVPVQWKLLLKGDVTLVK